MKKYIRSATDAKATLSIAEACNKLKDLGWSDHAIYEFKLGRPANVLTYEQVRRKIFSIIQHAMDSKQDAIDTAKDIADTLFE